MGLEYIYAVWLLHEAKKEINADNIKKVLTSVGIEPNDAMINAVLASLQGVDLDKIREESLSFAPAQPTPQQTEQKKEEKQENKAEEKKEEQALEGLSSLFGF
ncbi:MAG: 50S ribosomal protein P1 [Candidatus Nanopusillus sp.]|nr:50S ribosomal protein P1 [Candidatus Nanopusillus sp.]